jgi:hypothetical protein
MFRHLGRHQANTYDIIPIYNQQDATFLHFFISADSLHELELRSISSTIAASSSIGWQYLKLYVQLYAPDDGQRNRLKHVERL